MNVLTLYRVDVSLGDDHALRSYAVWAVSPGVAERVAVQHASDLLDVTAYEVSSAEREDFNETDYDDRIEVPVGLPVTLGYDNALEILNAISLAQEDLGYRIEELSDTGDYEPEDIDRMKEQVEAFGQIYKDILAATNTTS